MKRLTVLFFSVFLLLTTTPVNIFSGSRDRTQRIIKESHVTSRTVIEESRYRRSPRYYGRHYGYGATDLSVHAQAGFYYEPYYGSRHYYPRSERRVIVADSSCGGLIGFFFGDQNDSCGRKAAAEARKIEAEAALEIRKAELQRDVMLRGPSAFGGESGSVSFSGSEMGSGGMTVTRGQPIVRPATPSIPRCPRELLESEGIGYSSRARLFQDRNGHLCYYGGE